MGWFGKQRQEDQREASIQKAADLLGSMVAQTPEGKEANRSMGLIRAGGQAGIDELMEKFMTKMMQDPKEAARFFLAATPLMPKDDELAAMEIMRRIAVALTIIGGAPRR